MIPEVKCTCGAVIPDDNIYHSNGTNEEGEEYGTVDAVCQACGKSFETSQWGEWDSREDAIIYLQEYINTINITCKQNLK